MCDNVCVTIGLWWDDERAAYIGKRSVRYPGSTDIEPAWTLEAAVDPYRITRDPDPKSQLGRRAASICVRTWRGVGRLSTMTEQMTRDQVLAGIREEVAEQRDAALREADPAKRGRMLRHARSREDLAEEEAEAIAADIAENEQQAALSLRVPVSLSAALKARAVAERVPTSALVRRILTQALEQPRLPALTAEQVELVEEIARRVYRESA
jgi:hypothetical protein